MITRRSSKEQLDLTRELLERRSPAYIYSLLLGAQTPFEHSTHADKFIYEAELRTGLGAHFRYAEHLSAALRAFLRPGARGPGSGLWKGRRNRNSRSFFRTAARRGRLALPVSNLFLLCLPLFFQSRLLARHLLDDLLDLLRFLIGVGFVQLLLEEDFPLRELALINAVDFRQPPLSVRRTGSARIAGRTWTGVPSPARRRSSFPGRLVMRPRNGGSHLPSRFLILGKARRGRGILEEGYPSSAQHGPRIPRPARVAWKSHWRGVVDSGDSPTGDAELRPENKGCGDDRRRRPETAGGSSTSRAAYPARQAARRAERAAGPIQAAR